MPITGKYTYKNTAFRRYCKKNYQRQKHTEKTHWKNITVYIPGSSVCADEIISEYQDVLLREQFFFKPGNVASVINAIERFGINPGRKDAGDNGFPDSIVVTQQSLLTTALQNGLGCKFRIYAQAFLLEHSYRINQAFTNSIQRRGQFGPFPMNITYTSFDYLRDITIYSYICFCLVCPGAGFQVQMT